MFFDDLGRQVQGGVYRVNLNMSSMAAEILYKGFELEDFEIIQNLKCNYLRI